MHCLNSFRPPFADFSIIHRILQFSFQCRKLLIAIQSSQTIRRQHASTARPSLLILYNKHPIECAVHIAHNHPQFNAFETIHIIRAIIVLYYWSDWASAKIRQNCFCGMQLFVLMCEDDSRFVCERTHSLIHTNWFFSIYKCFPMSSRISCSTPIIFSLARVHTHKHEIMIICCCCAALHNSTLSDRHSVVAEWWTISTIVPDLFQLHAANVGSQWSAAMETVISGSDGIDIRTAHSEWARIKGKTKN